MRMYIHLYVGAGYTDTATKFMSQWKVLLETIGGRSGIDGWVILYAEENSVACCFQSQIYLPTGTKLISSGSSLKLLQRWADVLLKYQGMWTSCNARIMYWCCFQFTILVVVGIYSFEPIYPFICPNTVLWEVEMHFTQSKNKQLSRIPLVLLFRLLKILLEKCFNLSESCLMNRNYLGYKMKPVARTGWKLGAKVLRLTVMR